MDQLRSYLAGGSPASPVARLTGRRLASAEPGRVCFELPASPWFAGPNGLVHGGLLVFLADAALYAAVLSALPANTLSTTAEVSMTFLGQPPKATSTLLADARLIHLDSETALAETFVRDGADRLVAHGTSRCFVFPPVDPGIYPQLVAHVDTAESDGPDPWQRPLPVPGNGAVPADTDLQTGLGRLQAAAAGRVPRPPIDQLTGIRITKAEAGAVEFAMPASGWLANELGAVFGGAIGLLAKSATAASVQSLARTGATYQALDIKVNFLRPVPVDGSAIVATATVVHSGQLAVANTVLSHRGRTVALATGTTRLRARSR